MNNITNRSESGSAATADRRGSKDKDDSSEASGVMTANAILKVCKQHERDGMYRTPELNEVLYLHYKGYTKMGGLDEYTEVRVLWLEGNAFTRIEGLNHQQKLRTLYLHENCIESMEPLGQFELPLLDTLNLSDNFLHKIEGLSTFPVLRALHLKRNRIRGLEDVAHLLQCPFISVLDLTNNQIDDPEVLPAVFAKLPNLAILHLEGNPVTRAIPHYRKTVIYQCQKLKHLDDRPVFEEERRMCNAWGVGGLEAEKQERIRIAEEKEQQRLENMKVFDDLIASARRRKSELDARGEKEPPTLYYRLNSLGESLTDILAASRTAEEVAKDDEDEEDTDTEKEEEEEVTITFSVSEKGSSGGDTQVATSTTSTDSNPSLPSESEKAHEPFESRGMSSTEENLAPQELPNSPPVETPSVAVTVIPNFETSTASPVLTSTTISSSEQQEPSKLGTEATNTTAATVTTPAATSTSPTTAWNPENILEQYYEQVLQQQQQQQQNDENSDPTAAPIPPPIPKPWLLPAEVDEVDEAAMVLNVDSPAHRPLIYGTSKYSDLWALACAIPDQCYHHSEDEDEDEFGFDQTEEVEEEEEFGFDQTEEVEEEEENEVGDDEKEQYDSEDAEHVETKETTTLKWPPEPIPAQGSGSAAAVTPSGAPSSSSAMVRVEGGVTSHVDLSDCEITLVE